METVKGKFGMMPINKRIVEADANTLGAKRINELAYKISAGFSVGTLVVGILGIPHTEALVVLGGKHRILHSCGFSPTRPILWVIQIGIKIFEIFIVMLLSNKLTVLYPLVTCRHCIKPPMDEHTEAVVLKPSGISRRFSCYVT